MDPVLATFAALCFLLVGGGLYFGRGVIRTLLEAAKAHAAAYAPAYVKGGALVLIAMLAAFEQAFQPLTVEQAAHLAWWDWAIRFFKPIAAGLAVVVAFFDRSSAQPPNPPTRPPSP